MPTKRLSMRRIHRLTLRFGAGAGTRAIARELGISHSTVREYLACIAAAGSAGRCRPTPAAIWHRLIRRLCWKECTARKPEAEQRIENFARHS